MGLAIYGCGAFDLSLNVLCCMQHGGRSSMVGRRCGNEGMGIDKSDIRGIIHFDLPRRCVV